MNFLSRLILWNLPKIPQTPRGDIRAYEPRLTLAPFLVPLLACCILLVPLLISGLPYAYFRVLRWGVWGTFCYLLMGQKRAFLYRGGGPQTIIALIIALLFNPIHPFHFDRSTWAAIDFAAAIFFLALPILEALAYRQAHLDRYRNAIKHNERTGKSGLLPRMHGLNPCAIATLGRQTSTATARILQPDDSSNTQPHPVKTPLVASDPRSETWRSLRVKHVRPATDATADVDLELLRPGLEFRVADALALELLNRMKSPFLAIVSDLKKRQSPGLVPAVFVNLSDLGCADIAATQRIVVGYRGDSHGGNGSIVCVGADGKLLRHEGNLVCKRSLQGFLSMFFVIWASRHWGANWHGFYDVPEVLCFDEESVLRLLRSKVMQDFEPGDPRALPVLEIPSGIRIHEFNGYTRVECLGYQANVGTCDFWVSADSDGRLTDWGETIHLASTGSTFY